jgi:putative hydrolase of the HAD superfamily
MANREPVVKAVIFDLDNCLCAASAVGEDLYAPAFAALRAANRGRLGEAALQRAFADVWTTAFDTVAALHGFSQDMIDAGHAAFSVLEVGSPLIGYPDLPVVRELPVHRHLVTSGYRRLQESKVRALGIGGWFDSVIVDAVDDADHPGKQRIFQEILAAGRWSADEVMVVGDNPISELAAGRNLGMPTVQILRQGVQRSVEAWRHIHSLEELASLIESRRRAGGASSPKRNTRSMN